MRVKQNRVRYAIPTLYNPHAGGQHALEATASKIYTICWVSPMELGRENGPISGIPSRDLLSENSIPARFKRDEMRVRVKDKSQVEPQEIVTPFWSAGSIIRHIGVPGSIPPRLFRHRALRKHYVPVRGS